MLASRTFRDATQWVDMSSGRGARLESAFSIEDHQALCVERKSPFLDIYCLDKDFNRLLYRIGQYLQQFRLHSGRAPDRSKDRLFDISHPDSTA